MKKYHHLTYEQRCQIYALKKRHLSQTEIARELGVHASTISREFQRNTGKNGYRFKQAQRLSLSRRSAQYKKLTQELLDLVNSKLSLQWSPQQISGWLKKHSLPNVSHESIYLHVWSNKRQGGQLYKHLRRRGKKYNKRSQDASARGIIKERRDIEERPLEADKKERLGDWELDTIVGSGSQCALVSIVDRASKLTRLIKVVRKKAQNVADAIVSALKPYKENVCTLTSDNGKEFAFHKQISKALKAEFFFAKPYRSWERGLNEHTNGLVRQYFPKRTNFRKITKKKIQEVENLLNKRPRAILNYSTPEEVFFIKTRQFSFCAPQT